MANWESVLKSPIYIRDYMDSLKSKISGTIKPLSKGRGTFSLRLVPDSNKMPKIEITSKNGRYNILIIHPDGRYARLPKVGEPPIVNFTDVRLFGNEEIAEYMDAELKAQGAVLSTSASISRPTFGGYKHGKKRKDEED